MPQAHQIYDRARRIVDPDQLAGRGLDAGKTKLERLGIEPENLRRRERDMRRPARLGHGDLDHSRDLIGQIVYCRRRHQADDGAQRTVRNREEVGVGGQRCLRMAEDPSGQFDDRARVPRGIEIAGMDSVRYCLTRRGASKLITMSQPDEKPDRKSVHNRTQGAFLVFEKGPLTLGARAGF